MYRDFLFFVEYIERGSELYTTEDISRFVLTQRNDVRALFGVYTYVRALFGVYTYVRVLFGVYTYVRALFGVYTYARALFGVYTYVRALFGVYTYVRALFRSVYVCKGSFSEYIRKGSFRSIYMYITWSP